MTGLKDFYLDAGEKFNESLVPIIFLTGEVGPPVWLTYPLLPIVLLLISGELVSFKAYDDSRNLSVSSRLSFKYLDRSVKSELSKLQFPAYYL